ncbi:LicD family protein [Clostridium aestuarii]|uniref:LicD family protein n=1 Tax=Clostridium aestuarii TaxID=338193 RepID=A0ABT4CZH4_9CLOT|nr:LicD family protein [Clostridium aestuarii]MCY6484383.1 LicD family protein [Clostridium aestuarii]
MFDIKELREIQMYILDEVVKVCEKYNVDYWLDSGSLLGAIRHKGFIPWDDDIDIAMKQEDLEFIVPKLKDKLPSNIEIHDGRTSNYEMWGIPIKVMYKPSKIIPSKYIETSNFDEKIFIDIFSYIPVLKEKYTHMNKYLISFLTRCHTHDISSNYYKRKHKIRFYIFKFMKIFITKKVSKKIIDKYIIKNKNGESWTFNPYFWPMHVSQLFTNECYNNFKEVEFENRVYKIPVDYHQVLCKKYGENYMIPPSKREQDELKHIEGIEIYEYPWKK